MNLQLHVITAPTAPLPFRVKDAGRSLAELTRSDAHYPVPARALASSTGLSTSVPQSPRLRPTATESGSAVFKVDCFRCPAFLVQSPRLAEQMAIAADMEWVYEAGPVFQVENSNTHRQLTKLTDLDLEMALESNYHEAMDVIDGMFLFVFGGFQQNYKEVCGFR